MKRMIKAASKSAVKKTFKPNRSTEDMLNAFESKLNELEVNSSTVEGCNVAASDDIERSDREVEINGEDHDEKYEDFGGGFSCDETAAGEIYTLAEIKDYWNKNNTGDPVLAEYSDFETWWRDTRNNYMKRYYE